MCVLVCVLLLIADSGQKGEKWVDAEVALVEEEWRERKQEAVEEERKLWKQRVQEECDRRVQGEKEAATVVAKLQEDVKSRENMCSMCALIFLWGCRRGCSDWL